jgi:hypothetical protein
MPALLEVPQIKQVDYVPDSIAKAASYADRLSERAKAPIERIVVSLSGKTESRSVYCVADRINDRWIWRTYVADWAIPAALQLHESAQAEEFYVITKAHRKALDRGDAVCFWQGTAAPTKHPKADWTR